jgi:hypothetical protein
MSITETLARLNIIASDQTRQAYHEAGHAVMGFFGGQKVKSIAIDAWLRRRGGFAVGETRYHVSDYRQLIDYFNDVARSFGGAQAEMIYSGGIYLPGTKGDFENAAQIHAQFVIVREKYRAQYVFTIDDAWEMTGRTLSANWYLVEAIAQRLLEKGWLPGRSVEKVLRSAGAQTGRT